MDRFFGLFEGRTQDDWGWLEPVHTPQAEETGHENAVAV
jgi:branched-chain amino acid aminotransferase